MEESETTMADGEQHIIAAAYHIVKALTTGNTTINDDVRRTLTELQLHLSRITKIGDGEEEKTREIENKLKFTHNTIMGFQTKHLKIWNDDNDTAAASGNESMEYLQAVDEVQKLSENLVCMAPQQDARKAKELLKRAQNIQQLAMVKLQEELFQILAQHVQRLDNRCADEESMVSTEDSSFEEGFRRERSSPEYDQCIVVDLVHPQAIPLIRSIAQLMFDANYDQEFCQVFISFWKQELSDYLTTLNFKQLSIEEVLKMEWKRLNCRIKNWCRTTKSVIGIYLTNEKRLFSRILGTYGSKNSALSSCFVEASKASVSCLLNFGQAVAVGPLRPERLFCLLDMYEVLSNLQPDVEDLFSGKEVNGSLVRVEFQELRNTLGDSAKAILLELGNQIASKTSTTPFTNGGIHHLTKYVMNYIILLEEYGDTINSLLDERNGVNLGNTSRREEEDEKVTRTVSSSVSSPVAHLLQYAASMLEANLDAKSDLYRDEGLKHIFMMNNIHYMVQKIEKSQVRAYFGDEWIRRHIAKFRQHATTYERITWRSILSLFKHDGNKGKAILKQKCRDFTTAFEELYKSQTGWLIPDVQLRGELRIKTSQKVINGYRPFAGRIRESIGDKYIKYTEEDLGNHIWDLFEGSPKSMNHQRRR